MAGPAFHFQVLTLTIDALDAGSGADKQKAAVMKNHLNFASLGALGPDLLRYIPLDAGLLAKAAAPNGLSTLSPEETVAVIRSPLMFCYGMLFRLVVVDLWPFLQQVHDVLDQLDQVAADENTEGLADLEDEFNEISANAGKLNDLHANAEKMRNEVVGAAIALAKPLIQASTPLLTIQQWRAFEFARWFRTAEFARNLVNLASGNDALTAYAYGYCSHLASSVNGEPFIDNIVGGPYRTHWWRNRYVSNYVDSWTHGFYESGASMTGDNPSPVYEDWEELCEAKLHEKIAFGPSPTPGLDAAKGIAEGPLTLPEFPEELAALLADAAAATYEFSTDIVPPDLLQSETYKRAYHGLYSVLWFMTSGGPPLCVPQIGDPPANCTEEPDWVDSGGSPPQPTKETDGSTGSAVALAILAILLFLIGGWVAGLGAIAAAIAAAKGGMTIDWDQLRCNLYWQRRHFLEIEQAVRDLLIVAGLAYPASHQLGEIDTNGDTVPTDGINNSGSPLCRTRGSERYPEMMDASVGGTPDLNWLNYPTPGVEKPDTFALQDMNAYANHVIGDLPLMNGGMLTDNGAFPTRGVSFGGCVANAVEVIRTEAAGLVDYNLDGDRGYGWKTWRPKFGTEPKDGIVDPEQVF